MHTDLLPWTSFASQSFFQLHSIEYNFFFTVFVCTFRSIWCNFWLLAWLIAVGILHLKQLCK